MRLGAVVGEPVGEDVGPCVGLLDGCKDTEGLLLIRRQARRMLAWFRAY
jgi:hypothetical protein